LTPARATSDDRDIVRAPSPRGIAASALAAAAVLVVSGCSGPASSGSAPGAGWILSPRCERTREELSEVLVPSVIERLGTRYVLTVPCDGTHSIYIKAAPGIDLASLLGQPVCVRYRYVEERRVPSPCVRPPCPPAVERVLDIAEVRPPVATARGQACELR
jgi:hypothetical protein